VEIESYNVTIRNGPEVRDMDVKKRNDAGRDDDHDDLSQTCPECRGAGRIVLLVSVHPCERCGSTGRIDPILDQELPIDEISVRARNLLKRNGIRTYRQLAALRESEIRAWRNANENTVMELAELLAEQGLDFREEPE
jgi:Bacterial RNA polymerase, alpha chain C terminal domain